MSLIQDQLLFTQRDLARFQCYGPALRDQLIKEEFKRRIANSPYCYMSLGQKHQYYKMQIKDIKDRYIKGFGAGAIVGSLVGFLITSAIGGISGVLLFIFVLYISIYIGRELSVGPLRHLLPLIQCELQGLRYDHAKSDTRGEIFNPQGIGVNANINQDGQVSNQKGPVTADMHNQMRIDYKSKNNFNSSTIDSKRAIIKGYDGEHVEDLDELRRKAQIAMSRFKKDIRPH